MTIAPSSADTVPTPPATERVLADSERGVGGSASRSAPSVAARSLAKGAIRRWAVATAEQRGQVLDLVRQGQRTDHGVVAEHVEHRPATTPPVLERGDELHLGSRSAQ